MYRVSSVKQNDMKINNRTGAINHHDDRFNLSLWYFPRHNRSKTTNKHNDAEIEIGIAKKVSFLSASLISSKFSEWSSNSWYIPIKMLIPSGKVV